MVLGSEIESDLNQQQEPEDSASWDSSTCVSSQQLSSFLHEIRNPITTLRTLAKLLQKRLPVEDENHWISQSLEQECRHLQHLIHQFEQDLSSPHHLQLQPLDLVTFLQEQRSVLETIVLDHELTFSLKWDPDQTYPLVEADPVALRQILGNLVDNACKYTQAGGDLVIQLAQAEEHVLIEVCDTGVGIEAEDLDHIFTPFFRIAHDQPGKGLGLAISRDLVRQMGGDIEVNSKLGQGSVFRVRLALSDLFP